MARPIRTVATALVVLVGMLMVASLPDRLPVARAQFGPIAQNDAGSGQDAGNTPSDALLTASAMRTYAGNLSPAGTDVDWFRHDAPGAFCTQVEAALSTAGQVTLAGDPFLGASASRSALPQSHVKLALAAPEGGVPLLGIEPAPSIMSGGGTPTSPGRYTFRFVTQGLADLDPEADGESPEAGSSAATAAPVPAPCFAGRLASGDHADHYVFDVTSPREIALSFAIARGGQDAQVSLVSPSGVTHATLSSGGAADLYASETGRWSLVVTRAPTQSPGLAATLHPLLGAGQAAALLEDTDYLLAMSTGPGSDPCRPSC